MASLGQARTVCWPLKLLTVLDLEAPFVSPPGRQGKSKSEARENGCRSRGSTLRSGLRPPLRALPLDRQDSQSQVRNGLDESSVHAKSGETL